MSFTDTSSQLGTASSPSVKSSARSTVSLVSQCSVPERDTPMILTVEDARPDDSESASPTVSLLSQDPDTPMILMVDEADEVMLKKLRRLIQRRPDDNKGAVPSTAVSLLSPCAVPKAALRRSRDDGSAPADAPPRQRPRGEHDIVAQYMREISSLHAGVGRAHGRPEALAYRRLRLESLVELLWYELDNALEEAERHS